MPSAKSRDLSEANSLKQASHEKGQSISIYIEAKGVLLDGPDPSLTSCSITHTYIPLSDFLLDNTDD